ncbi:MAG: DUF6089 family protein, partial [Paludibacter sp.]|nr:DUF6089 family protein [Paludibacter sp.]
MYKKIPVLLWAMLCAFTVMAQDFYYAEAGVNGGLSNYTGEIRKNLFEEPSLAYGLIYRQKFNTRMAVHANWNMTRLVSKEFSEIRNTVNYVDVCGEFNFFDLEKRVYKPFSKEYSPFIFAGPALFIYEYERKPQIDLGLSVGVGMKVILGKHVNFNAMFAYRLLGTDKIEGRKEFDNPLGLNGANPLNNDM